jgi:hypothetical protein
MGDPPMFHSRDEDALTKMRNHGDTEFTEKKTHGEIVVILRALRVWRGEFCQGLNVFADERRLD